MLPSDLLAVRRRKGNIWPRYARLSDENLALAQQLIQAYEDHIGEKKHVLEEIAGELESTSYDYRFVRGLSALLDRRGVFQCNIDLDPVDLRRRVFQTTRKLGLPTLPKDRDKIIESVASETGLSSNTVEESLYADLESEQVLTEFETLTPFQLIQDYNVSLTQTLLFNSTELSFTASGNWQRIFYTVKKLGLIYDSFKKDTFWVKIDGPASLFKLTRRYGTALAKLFPAIITNPEYRVEAKIFWKYTNRIYDFEIWSSKHSVIFGKTTGLDISFDSSVEQKFATQFEALDSGWHLRREPEPVPAGRYVIIPDFSFERDGVKVYMEVVGFWTAEYLKRKIEKLKKINVEMIIAVDEDLACEKLTKLEKSKTLKIIFYRNKIALPPILHYLEEAFRQTKEKQISFIQNLPVKFVDPFVQYDDFAARIGVSTESVRTVLMDNPPEGYTVLPNGLMKKDKLNKIKMMI
ncbi:MAG: DUF790 family protein, partial [Candidatus Bathyarchaeota archaeon]